MRSSRWLVLLALASCGGSSQTNVPPAECTVGASIACACANGRTGAQICKADHTLEPCSCTAGAGGSGGSDAAADGATPHDATDDVSTGAGGAQPDGAITDAADSSPDGATDATDDVSTGAGGAQPDGATADAADSSPDADAAAAANPSCAGGLTCNGQSCCAAATIPAGSFLMGRSSSGADQCPGAMQCLADEQPEHPAMLSAFRLDVYEVTVGRFRNFVAAYVDNVQSAPAPGLGANPNILDSGWSHGWDLYLAVSAAAFMTNLKCDATGQTWTDTPGPNENKAITCVNWYEAFAFCIWDGGRLPTEAEWEYVAAGGMDNRLYPWGAAAPDCTYANFTMSCVGGVVAVGSTPKGDGRWGNADLAGNAWEWVLDRRDLNWYSGGGATCTDCANLTIGSNRARRGGSFGGLATNSRAAARQSFDIDVSNHSYDMGVRCARSAL
jgi:formylglycine-generating enzyme